MMMERLNLQNTKEDSMQALERIQQQGQHFRNSNVRFEELSKGYTLSEDLY